MGCMLVNNIHLAIILNYPICFKNLTYQSMRRSCHICKEVIVYS